MPIYYPRSPDVSIAVKSVEYVSPQDWLAGVEDDASGRPTEQQLYASVCWLYRCIQLRAQSIANLPFQVTKKGQKDPIEWPFADSLPDLLFRTEASLLLYGAAYWWRIHNTRRDLGFRWLLPPTISYEVVDHKKGTLLFKRRSEYPEKPMELDESDIVYFWEPALTKEIGPGKAAATVSLTDGRLLSYALTYAASFFEQGALPGVLLTVEGNPSSTEMEKLEKWWKRLLLGVRNAWRAVAIRASVKPVIVSRPISDLAMPELTEVARQNICVALGVRESMLIQGGTSFATARQDRLSFYEETINPRASWLQSILNRQIFHPQQLEFRFLAEMLDVMQEEERARADSLLRLVNGGVPTVLAMQILGYELPPKWSWEDVQEAVDAAPPRVGRGAPRGAQGGDIDNPYNEGAPESTLRNAGLLTQDETYYQAGRDLALWQRKALRWLGQEGHAQAPFESTAIPMGVHQYVERSLAEALDAEAVRGSFQAARNVLAMTLSSAAYGDAEGNGHGD